MEKSKNIIIKFFIKRQDNYLFWILLALIVKGAFLIFQIHQHFLNNIPGFIGSVGGDTPGYLNPIDNFLKTGIYNSIARMPGYGVVYFFLRLLFTKALACNIIIILQVIADAISVYVLALIARICFSSDKLFYLTFYCYLISSFTSIFDAILLTESLTTSSIIFSLYFFVKYTQNYRLKNLLFAGFFLTWSIFLRQVYFPSLFFIGMFLIYSLYKKNYALIIKSIIYFTIPFLLVESYWVARNYKTYHKFIPFIQLYAFYPNYTNYHFALFRFVRSWGGDYVEWNPKSDIKWFLPQSTITPTEKESGSKYKTTLPNYIYTTKFNIDSLKTLRNYIGIIEYTDSSQPIRNYYNNLLIKKLDFYTLSVQNEHPFLYYIKAPLLITKNFLLNSGTYNLFNKPYYKLNLIEISFKVFMSVIYLWVVVFGMLGAFFCWRDWFKPNYKGLLSIITLYSVLVYPFIFRASEYRYVVPAYPLLLLFATFLSLTLFTKFFIKKARNTFITKVN